ncbi:MAG: ribulose-phosphate 3-epimerase [Oscillospiraceae bacterium]|nr:ribulose-phosphate 3-epimerase [Oscillospiraceae bacterium]
MKTIVSASILSADLCDLRSELIRTEKSGAEYVHFDVMDGVFVNNISYGIPVLKCVRKATDMFLDVHLMITEPHRYIKEFAESGADMITFHTEAGSDVSDTIKLIRSFGKKAGIAIKPGTPVSEVYKFAGDVDMILVMTVEPGFGGQGFIPETEEKIRALRSFCDSKGIELDIQVDGGINAETSRRVREDGANVLVAGSYLFKAPDMAAAVKAMRE